MPDLKLPRERIIGSDVLMNVVNANAIERQGGRRFAVLACGHTVFTKAVASKRCPRCQHMFETGHDWDAFRHLGAQDEMA